MISAIIIDDELSAIKTLELMLERYVPEIRVVQTLNNPSVAIDTIPKINPDLIFLDIQMPVISGFDLLKKLPRINCSIIFTTAHDKYAIEAIRFSALDYLMKPIDAEELQNAVERFKLQKEQTETNKLLYNNFLNNISSNNQEAFKLALPTTEGTFFFNPEEIVRIEGENNYSRFYFLNNKPMLLSRTLKEYEEILVNHGFIRVHKSHLINLKYVLTCTTDGILTMKDNSKVEISRRRKDEVLNALKTV